MNGQPLNGSSPRPFYVFGHNPNTIDDARAALSAGANALEPDVQIGASGDLVVAHDAYQSGKISLVDYLVRLRDLAFEYPLALVVFDVKSEAATKDRGLEILKAIRTHLNHSGIDINIIISVANRDDGALFDSIIGPEAQVQLGPREGVQVDEEDNAGDIVRFFLDEKKYQGNIAYGDGTAAGGPHLPRAIDGAAGIRAATGYPKAVTYVYTIEHVTTMNAFIDAGVDGIIPDRFPPPDTLDPTYVERLRSVVDGRSDIFLARRDYNPFQSPNEAYALRVRTSNDELLGGEGTNADLTFTITGSLGAASATVNTGYLNPLYNSHRMESGNTDWVTIPSKNLGDLESISIHNGGGFESDWKLQDIVVYSAQWLNPDLSHYYTATLNDWIESDSSKTLPLIPHFQPPNALVDEYVWGATDYGYSNGTSNAPWKQLVDAYNWVQPGGTIHIAQGVYHERLQPLTKRCTLKLWGIHGTGPVVIGSL